MKKILRSMLAMFMVIVALVAAGCGSDIHTVYVEKQAPVAMYLDPVNKTQKFVLSFDENGNINNEALYGSGSLDLKANQIVSADYTSHRKFMRVDPVVDWRTHTITLNFDDIINNDEYVFIVLNFLQGDSYPVYVANAAIITTKPMLFYRWEASYNYGNSEETFIRIDPNGYNVDISGEFGCDDFVGLEEYINSEDVDHIEWMQLDGISYPAPIEIKTEEKYAGSYKFRIPNVQLQIDQLYGTNPTTIGKLLVVLKSGRKVPLNMYSWGIYIADSRILNFAQPFEDKSIIMITMSQQ